MAMLLSPAYEKGRHDNSELREFKTSGFLDKWLMGFQLEISSAFFFFEKELYKSAILETVLFTGITIPFIVFQILAGVCFGLLSLWKYFTIFGAICEVIAIILFFALIIVGPLITDMYHRVSEKTERMLDGEDESPASGPRCSGFCLVFILVYTGTGILEFFILFPIALFCILCLIILPVGIILLLIFSSFVRAWTSFKIVFLRHGLDYLGLIKFFFMTPEVFPLYMGIGAGNWCMRKILKRFPGGTFLTHIVTVVTATRFYHFFKLNDCTLPSTMQDRPPVVGGQVFLDQGPADQMYPNVVSQPIDQQPTIAYSEENDNMKGDF